MDFQYGNNADFVAKGNHKSRNILLTGATGFLAGHFLFWRLQLPGTMYVLVRASDMEAGKQRIYDSLETASQSYEIPLPSQEELDKKIVCVLGDLMEPNCGISSAVIDKLTDAKIDQVWHSAANMAFLPKDRENLIHANVSGTKSMMSVSKLIGAERFVYISTCYTAGNLKGPVKEELHPHGHTFTNCYEESKFLAEHEVVKFAEENGMTYNILRPSMVMGPMESMQSGGTRFGVYGWAKTLYKNYNTFSRVNRRIRCEVPTNTTMNMYPVDHVVFDMMYLDSIDFGDQPIYNLCNRIHSNVREALTVADKAVGTDAMEWVEKLDVEDHTQMEKIYHDSTAFARCYYFSEKEFQRSLPDPEHMFDLPELETVIKNYMVELQEQEEKAKFDAHEVTSWDGQVLSAYTRGDDSLPAVVFVNAYGLPLQFSVPMSRHISKKYRFVTWDSRWVPDTTQPFDLEKCDSLTHAKDLMAVLDHLGIEQCSLVGWSSGVQVSLRAMHEYPDRIQSAVIMGAGVSLRNDDQVIETEYQQGLRSLFPTIAKSHRNAKMYCDMIFGDTTKVDSGEQSQVGSMLTCLDPKVSEMTSACFKDPESLYRYTNMMYRNFEEREDAYTSDIETPVLVWGSEADQITHPSIARALAKALKNGELRMSEDATHFAAYYEDWVAEMIIEFVDRHVSYANNESSDNAKAG